MSNEFTWWTESDEIAYKSALELPAHIIKLSLNDGKLTAILEDGRSVDVSCMLSDDKTTH